MWYVAKWPLLLAILPFLRVTLPFSRWEISCILHRLAIRGIGTSFHPVALRNSACVTPSGRKARES